MSQLGSLSRWEVRASLTVCRNKTVVSIARSRTIVRKIASLRLNVAIAIYSPVALAAGRA